VWEQSGSLYEHKPGEIIPDVHFYSNDFTFSVKLTPTHPPGRGHVGVILARHTSGVAAGFGLTAMRSGHVTLSIWSDVTSYHARPPPWVPACVEDPSSVEHNGIWAGDLTSAKPLKFDVEQTVTFERIGNTLSLAVDGVASCTVTVGAWSDTDKVVLDPPLMLGNDNAGIHPGFQGTMSDAYICMPLP